MAFEMIQPGPAPTPNTAPPKDKPAEAPAANTGTVSLDDAIKGGEHTKMGVFSVSDMSQGSGASRPSGSSVSLGGLIQGKIAVDLMDALVPSLLVILFAKLKIAAKKSDFGLTVSEKNTIAPLAEAYLNSVNINFDSPGQALAITLLIIYGGKAIEKGGVSFVERKASEMDGTIPIQSRPAPAPVVPITTVNPMTNPGAGKAKAPEPKIKEAPAPVVNIPELRPYDENDVSAVMRKRKRGREDAIDWLNKNWVKKGGVI